MSKRIVKDPGFFWQIVVLAIMVIAVAAMFFVVVFKDDDGATISNNETVEVRVAQTNAVPTPRPLPSGSAVARTDDVVGG